MDSNESLITHLIRSGVLKTPDIIAAFEKIDRQNFIRPDNFSDAYGDYPLPIGQNQTISQPYTVAFMLELLQAGSTDKILDVGSGSGWTTALLADLVDKGGYVYGTEIIPELVDFGRENLSKCGIVNADIYLAGQQLGLAEQAPYNRILVSASGDDLPNELLFQLGIGGRMVIPIQNSIWKVDKKGNKEFKYERFPGFVFVPLVH